MSDRMVDKGSASTGSMDGSTVSVEDTGMTIEEMLKSGPSMMPVHLDNDHFLETIKECYRDDPFFKLIMDDPTAN